MSEDPRAIISEAATKYGIPPKVLWGVYGTETSFGKNVNTSSAGAVGPFQFEPATAKSLGVNPYDFRSAAFGAAKYLSQFKGRGTGGMLSAYNAGPAGGYQSDYVTKTLANAQTFDSSKVGQARESAQQRGPRPSQVREQAVQGFNKPAFEQAAQQAKGERAAASLFTGGGAGDSILREALNRAGTPPTTQQYSVVKTPTGTIAVRNGSPNPQASNNLHGILPEGAQVLHMARKDQGRDVQLKPGQQLLAPGNFIYLGTKSDPSGFGPDYPLIKVLDGEFAGHTLYYGHTDAAQGLVPGKQYARGTHVATTSTSGHNAPPGWLELGYAPGGTPGPFGQPSPF